MKYGIYLYYDHVAQSPASPVLSLAPNDEAAARDFGGMLRSPQFPSDRNIGDYNLVKLGTYDVMQNVIVDVAQDPTAHPIVKGAQIRAQLQQLALVKNGSEDAQRPEDPSASDSAPESDYMIKSHYPTKAGSNA